MRPGRKPRRKALIPLKNSRIRRRRRARKGLAQPAVAAPYGRATATLSGDAAGAAFDDRANTASPSASVEAVRRLVPEAAQDFAASPAAPGDCALIALDGLHAAHDAMRGQTFNPDALSNLALDPPPRKLLVVKPGDHVQGGFAAIASHIPNAAANGPLSQRPRANAHARLTPPIRPIVAAPRTPGG